MRDWMINTATCLVAILVSLGAAEVLLRASPSLISIRVLDRFHNDLRTPIATELGFPTATERRLVTSKERGDEGPPFRIYEPGRRYHALADPEDVAVGAVSNPRMDDLGFCNPEGKAKRDAVDVIMIGDSFTDCTLVAPEDTFTAMIEERTGLTTYNISVRGIGPYEELVLLRKFGLDMRPRAVVLNVYEGNDLRDVLRYIDFARHGVERDLDERMGGVFEVSYALAYLKAWVEVAIDRIKEHRQINYRYSVEVEGVRTPMNVTNSDSDEVRFARRVAQGEVQLDVFAEPLEAFVELSEQHDFIPVVTLHPSAHTGYLGSVEFQDEDIGRQVAAFSAAQRAWFSEHAERIGYHFVDVVPAFHEKVASRPVAFFPANVHFTRDGHAIVAEALGPALGELLGKH